MPSGNQAGPLYRDSAVNVSLGLLLLGTSVTHKHHLPENRSACLEAFIGGSRSGAFTHLLGKQKDSALCTAITAPNFFFKSQSGKHKAAKAARAAAKAPQCSGIPFPLLERGEKTPEVFDAKLAFQRQ